MYSSTAKELWGKTLSVGKGRLSARKCLWRRCRRHHRGQVKTPTTPWQDYSLTPTEAEHVRSRGVLLAGSGTGYERKSNNGKKPEHSLDINTHTNTNLNKKIHENVQICLEMRKQQAYKKKNRSEETTTTNWLTLNIYRKDTERSS